jgi:hypothetical protein
VPEALSTDDWLLAVAILWALASITIEWILEQLGVEFDYE